MALTDKQEQDAVRALEQVARLIHTYFVALMASGFSEEQAILLAGTYQEQITAPQNSRPLFGTN